MNSGLHQYFKYQPGARNSTRKYAPQIDTRAGGGFVVLAGNPGYEVVHDCELADFPVLTNGKANGRHLDLNEAKTTADIDALIEAAHKPGRWHDSMVRATASLHSRGVPHAVILDLLAARVTLAGYAIEQTRAQLAAMLRGADEKAERGEWDPPKKNGAGKIRWLEVTPRGNPRASYYNARIALLSFTGFKFGYERFADHAFFEHEGETHQLTDEASAMFRQGILDTYHFDPGKENVHDACTQLCLESAHDRVLDRLNALAWDGVERLNSWLSDYLGADESALNSAFGRKFLIAMVRRARQPGCKFDCILTLIGAQGAGKSLTARILAGEDALFSDQDVLHLDDKRQLEALEGIWVYELSDLAGLPKSDIDKVKAFVSRTHDRARKAWGRFRANQPRRSVFIATTNRETFLRDYTGNRRFWPVRVGDIQLKALARDRDQLLAEAAHAEAAGESIMLPAELWCDAAALQDEHLEDDPWAEMLRPIIGTRHGDEERILFADVAGIVGLDRKDQTRAAQARVTEVMTRLGWERIGKAQRVGGKVGKCYRRSVTNDETVTKKGEQYE